MIKKQTILFAKGKKYYCNKEQEELQGSFWEAKNTSY